MNNPPDTPARAGRLVRPQTRAWREHLSKAQSSTKEAHSHRAILREHLEQAELLAKHRKANQLQQLLTSSQWDLQQQALQKYSEDAAIIPVRQIVPLIVRAITDPRSMLVNAASDAAVTAGKVELDNGGMTNEEAILVWKACISGVAVSKKVMSDARRRAAFAVLRYRSDEFWQIVLEYTFDKQTEPRVLVVQCIQVLIEEKTEEEVKRYAQHVLRGICDRAEDVRKACRELMAVYERRFGIEARERLVGGLDADIKRRLKPSPKPGNGIAKGSKGSLKEMMEARRAAIRAQRAALKAAAGSKDQQGKADVPMDASKDTL